MWGAFFEHLRLSGLWRQKCAQASLFDRLRSSREHIFSTARSADEEKRLGALFLTRVPGVRVGSLFGAGVFEPFRFLVRFFRRELKS